MKASRLLRVSWDVGFVANGVGKLFARRHFAEAIAGHKDFDFRQHLQNHRHTDLQLKDIIAQICTVHTDRGDHRLNRVRHDGLIRNGKQNILVNGYNAAADVFPACRVGKQDVDRHINLAPHAGEARPVAQALYGQIANGALRCGRAAAFKCNGHIGLRVGRLCGLIVGYAATASGHQTIADQGYPLLIELLLLQATVIHALNLNTDLFVQAVEHVVPAYAARTAGGIGIFVREEFKRILFSTFLCLAMRQGRPSPHRR